MKIIKIISLLTTLSIFLCSCSNNDPIAPTGNTTEYFKYTVDNGTEQVFDFEIESHFESVGQSPIAITYEFNAVAQTNNTDSSIKRLSGAFSFANESTFFTNNNYSWGASDGTNVKFYFSSIRNDFLIGYNQAITCNISIHPTNVNDYIEFSFSGNYTDTSGNSHTIQGEARIKRGINENY